MIAATLQSKLRKDSPNKRFYFQFSSPRNYFSLLQTPFLPQSVTVTVRLMGFVRITCANAKKVTLGLVVTSRSVLTTAAVQPVEVTAISPLSPALILTLRCSVCAIRGTLETGVPLE